MGLWRVRMAALRLRCIICSYMGLSLSSSFFRALFNAAVFLLRQPLHPYIACYASYVLNDTVTPASYKKLPEKQ